MNAGSASSVGRVWWPDTTSFAGVGDRGHNDRPVALSRESSGRTARQKGLFGACLMGSEACHYPAGWVAFAALQAQCLLRSLRPPTV